MDRDKDGEKEKKKNIPARHHVSVAVPSPEQGRRRRRWDPEETHFPGLHVPGGPGARFLPREVQAEPPSFLFLAMSIGTTWDLERLWEQARYLCPTKTSRFAFVSAGQYFPARV